MVGRLARWMLSLAVVATGSLAETYVVSIGVERYDDPGISPLSYAAADANGVAGWFGDAGVPADHLVLLSTATAEPARRPTKFAVLRALQQVRDRARANDTLIIFFAGHGVEREGEAYLLTADSLREELADTALAMATVRSVLSTVQAANVALWIDACRNDPDSGRSTSDATMDDSLARGLRPRLGSQPQARQPALLLACSVGERAWEMPDEGHGAFTYFLLQGLSGAAADAAGSLTLTSLASYLQRELPAWAQRAKRVQTPWLDNPANLDFVLLPNRRPAEPRPAPTTPDLPAGAPPGWPTYLNSFRPPASMGWDRFRVASADGMPQVFVPAGPAWIGSPPGEEHRVEHEGPEREIYMSAYWIDLHEVTNEQFVMFLRAVRPTAEERATMITLRGETGMFAEPLSDADIQEARGDYRIVPGRERWPVRYVSWAGASEYATWAGRRLPTEAQWEKAARGAVDRAFPWGEPWDASRVVVGRPQPVASRLPNGFGLFDVLGNVREWCRDWFDERWYDSMPDHDPVRSEPLNGPDRSDCHSLRGGGYTSPTEPVPPGQGFTLAFILELRCAYREGSPFYEDGSEDVGFRCVSDP